MFASNQVHFRGCRNGHQPSGSGGRLLDLRPDPQLRLKVLLNRQQIRVTNANPTSIQLYILPPHQIPTCISLEMNFELQTIVLVLHNFVLNKYTIQSLVNC